MWNMNIKVVALLVALLAVSHCDQSVRAPSSSPSLISKGFIDDNSFRVVCRGFPEEGLTGVERTESAKRAALLSAYAFIQAEFIDKVAPDRDGKVEKFEVGNDAAIVYYVVSKRGLKKLRRPDQKP